MGFLPVPGSKPIPSNREEQIEQLERLARASERSGDEQTAALYRRQAEVLRDKERTV